eukprot:scaffold1133_cov84-Cylindrotheca_fusiformis.AAC.4
MTRFEGTQIDQLVGYIVSSACNCIDSTPDCSMVANLTDYNFNACDAEPKYSRTCREEEGSVCCEIVDEKGEMKCCQSETETAIEYECVAGSDTGKITLSNSSCTATHNGESCTCEYCIAPDGNTTGIAAYDCTEFGGSKRVCPDMQSEEFMALTLLLSLGGVLELPLRYEMVDPRTRNAASNGFVLTVAFAISSLGAVGLLF